LDGRGVSRDATLAHRSYMKAAQQGHERAMSLVGRCCEEGWGTRRNLDAAADWYRRSAEAGYFRGQYNWASMLLKAGRFEEAAAWFERAAAGGTAAVRRAVAELIARAGARSV
jgi:TPR repeat protein